MFLLYNNNSNQPASYIKLPSVFLPVSVVFVHLVNYER